MRNFESNARLGKSWLGQTLRKMGKSVWQEGGESRVESERHLEVGRLFSSS